MNSNSSTIPYSEACERNKDPILKVIRPYLMAVNRVLEIGSGTAQHAIFFADALPHLRWQTADQEHYLEGIRAQLNNAKLTNVESPLEIDVNQATWLAKPDKYPLVYTANTLHIMSEVEVRKFFTGLNQVIDDDAILIIYGPFCYHGKFTSQSNADFDASLRSRGVGSGIRDFELIQSLAKELNFSLIEDVPMPANNQTLVWQHQSEEKSCES